MQNENLLDGLRINDFVKLLTLILTIYYILVLCLRKFHLNVSYSHVPLGQPEQRHCYMHEFTTF